MSVMLACAPRCDEVARVEKMGWTKDSHSTRLYLWGALLGNGEFST
jgi:hypothetical protein